MSNLAVKRLLSEYRELRAKPEPDFVAGPADMDDLFVWHFTIKGPRDTAFEGGIYHGKIVFPSGYPNEPPDIYFMTPNGRFETNKRLCLSFTSYHPESWTTAWGVSTILTSVIAFMPTRAEGAIGGLDSSDAERRKYAIESRQWHCKDCELEIEPDPIPEEKKEGENAEPEKEETVEEPNTEVKEETEEEVKEVAKEEEDAKEEPKEEIVEEKKAEIDEEKEKEAKQARMNAAILDFYKENQRKRLEEEKNEAHEEDEVEGQKEEVIDFSKFEESDEKVEKDEPKEDEGKIEENIDVEPQEEENAHQEEEMIPEKLIEDGPIEVENCIDFETLKEGGINTKKQFYPLLDIPIIVVFLFLCFLIFNSYFNFVKIF